MSTLYPKISGKPADLRTNISCLNLSPPLTTVPLIGTVKLHGTHADVLIHADLSITLQSRNVSTLTLKNDNIGYAAFMLPLKPHIFTLRDLYHARFRELNPNIEIQPEHPLIIAGEWIGTGIQKGVAISELSRRFVIVSVSINNIWQPDHLYSSISKESVGIYNISRSGFFHHNLDLLSLPASLDEMKAQTLAVEKACPFATTFNISGIGEGIVWKANYPSIPNTADFWLKTKGPLHAITSVAKLPKNPQSMEQEQRAEAFAKAVVTEGRLQQGWDYLREMGVEQGMRGLGTFLKWLWEDCETEEGGEMRECGVEREKGKVQVYRIAKTWFIGRVKRGEEDDERFKPR